MTVNQQNPKDKLVERTCRVVDPVVVCRAGHCISRSNRGSRIERSRVVQAEMRDKVDVKPISVCATGLGGVRVGRLEGLKGLGDLESCDGQSRRLG